ncbi:30S ribosomal protein S4 [Candidatus Woesearchaeota archaeon]|nr:30S ribosomal protein S4 [Candidatus Woesearchaeota archaeon]
MGDPKRIRKKYDTPSHPWIKSRIENEKRLAREFGTKSKKEIWKMETVLKNFKNQAKSLISLNTDQSKIETEHLFRRVKQLGLVNGDVTFDSILGLSVDHLMARRLQSVVYTKGLAKSVGQARQFIVHGHVLVDGKKITSPAYLVSQKEESGVSFAVSSSLFSENHPERASLEKLAEIRAEKEAEAKRIAEAEAKRLAQEEKAKAEGEENVDLPDEDVLEEEGDEQ